jgi:hypothetical protein
MLRVIMLGLLTFALSTKIYADDDHSDDICTSSSPQVCAHLGHFSKLNTSSEVQFVTHIMTPQEEQVNHISVDLWMPSSGLISSPVTLSQFGVNKYKIASAYFRVSGQWLVRVRFVLAGVSYQLNIPVEVTE